MGRYDDTLLLRYESETLLSAVEGRSREVQRRRERERERAMLHTTPRALLGLRSTRWRRTYVSHHQLSPSHRKGQTQQEPSGLLALEA